MLFIHYVREFTLKYIYNNINIFYLKRYFATWVFIMGINVCITSKIAGFPKVLGCIDGTFIKVRTPAHKIKSTYVNRHDIPSITLQPKERQCAYNALLMRIQLHWLQNHINYVLKMRLS